MQPNGKLFIELLQKTSPEAVRLAHLISIAARVEPELLRAMRLQHLPGVDAGAEADLWFSPLVQASSPLGLVLRQDVLAELRVEMAKEENRSTLDAAWKTLQLVHEFTPAAVRLEEHVTYLSLSGASEEEIDNSLKPAVAALARPNNEKAIHWARRVLPRLPEKAQSTMAAQILDVKAARKLGKSFLLGNPSPDAVRLVDWLAPSDAEETTVGVRLLDLHRGAKWEFSHPPTTQAYVIDVPKSDPIVIEIEWDQDDRRENKQVLLHQNNYVTVPDPGVEISIRTGINKSYRIKPDQRKDEEEVSSETDKTPSTDFLSVGESPQSGLTLGHVLQESRGKIRGLAWSPYGQFLAAACDDQFIRIWGVDTSELILSLATEGGSTLCVAWSPDGQFLAAGGEDNTLRIWNTSKWSLIRVLRQHSNSISCVGWSPDGQLLASGSYDNTVRVWDTQSWELSQVFAGHDDWVRDLAWSPDGQRLASCGDDYLINVWQVNGPEVPQVLDGHEDWVRCLCWLPDGLSLVSGSDDRTIRIWDAETGRLKQHLEGHTEGINRLSVSASGDLICSNSTDGTVRIWRTDPFWDVVTVIRESTGNEPLGLAFHPSLPRLATLGSNNSIIRIWDLNVGLLTASQETVSVQYTTARIVLVGDSGVGKSGLGLRLAHSEFKPQASTHGQQFWVLDQLGATRRDGTQCEAVLWDLAGQYNYRAIHSLFLENIDLALVLFDTTNRVDPFKGVQFWLQQLKRGGVLPPTILVGGRVDRGMAVVSQAELDQFCERYGISGGYVGTSAYTGEGIDILLERIREQIPWDEMAATVSTVTFKHIRDFVLALKERADSGVLISPPNLLERLQTNNPDLNFTHAEMMTAVGNLETYGYVSVLRSSSDEQHILLTPDLLVSLASSIVMLAEKHPRELGAVSETELLQGKFQFDELSGTSLDDIQILLDAVALRFIEHNFCFRETLNNETWLIFPGLIKQRRPLGEDLPTEDNIVYVVRGNVENLFASLVVQLGYSPTFTRASLWQNHARFESDDGEICGFHVAEKGEGELELVLYFSDRLLPNGRVLFQALFERLLSQREVQVTRYPPLLCPNGHRQERATVTKRLRENKRFLFCDECGEKIDISNIDQPLSGGIGASPWLHREEAATRLRSTYEVQLTKVKAYRRDFPAPRCFISHVDSESRFAGKLAFDLREAGIYVIEEVAQVEPDDFVVGLDMHSYSLDTPAFLRSFRTDYSKLATYTQLVNTRLGKEQLISLTLTGRTGTHEFKDCQIGSFYDQTHYPVDLFNLILNLYVIPLTHAGFSPLRQALHEQWEQTLAGPTALKVFISYSHKDEGFKDELVTVLAGLQRRGVIDTWQDRRLEPGADWQEAFKQTVAECDLALLLISADFLASYYIYEEELRVLRKRRQQANLRVIPIIVRPCYWQSDPLLKDLQVLPRDGKPLIKFAVATGERDQAWVDIAQVIEQYAELKEPPFEA
ncbi:MAG TPA: TIR domain-containing protein [Pyrinomonadaceae bacterium]|nr:TIR domain-containing protein [Pyrinomonadaceae bacterium]